MFPRMPHLCAPWLPVSCFLFSSSALWLRDEAVTSLHVYHFSAVFKATLCNLYWAAAPPAATGCHHMSRVKAITDKITDTLNFNTWPRPWTWFVTSGRFSSAVEVKTPTPMIPRCFTTHNTGYYPWSSASWPRRAAAVTNPPNSDSLSSSCCFKKENNRSCILLLYSENKWNWESLIKVNKLQLTSVHTWKSSLIRLLFKCSSTTVLHIKALK